MMIFTIWSEGYRATGDSRGAQIIGQAEADTFREACAKWFAANPARSYDPERNTLWGCRLFPNEADARKSFG